MVGTVKTRVVFLHPTPPCTTTLLSGDGILSLEEYRAFYRDFVEVSPDKLDRVTQEGYRTMTAVKKKQKISKKKSQKIAKKPCNFFFFVSPQPPQPPPQAGDHKLNQENFNFCFANFLLGRSIYGPGKYIFGVFDNSDMDEKFEVLYDEEEEE